MQKVIDYLISCNALFIPVLILEKALCFQAHVRVLACLCNGKVV